MQKNKKDNDEFVGDRIAKVIARSGVCSRRDAEKLIAEGLVIVNGQVIASPALNVTENDVITVRGEPLKEPDKVRIWRYNKPAGLITSHKDTKGRPTVFSALPAEMPRVISVGRLDFNSEGLLLLTNDGEAARFMENPQTAWKRKYRVRVHGDVSAEVLGRLSKGVTINGVKYGKAEIVFEKKQGTNNWLLITINEGKNREIRKMMEFFGLQVTRLIRVAYGPFQLGSLPSGAIEEVKGKIISEQLGIKLVSQRKKDADNRRKI